MFKKIKGYLKFLYYGQMCGYSKFMGKTYIHFKRKIYCLEDSKWANQIIEKLDDFWGTSEAEALKPLFNTRNKAMNNYLNGMKEELHLQNVVGVPDKGFIKLKKKDVKGKYTYKVTAYTRKGIKNV